MFPKRYHNQILVHFSKMPVIPTHLIPVINENAKVVWPADSLILNGNLFNQERLVLRARHNRINPVLTIIQHINYLYVSTAGYQVLFSFGLTGMILRGVDNGKPNRTNPAF